MAKLARPRALREISQVLARTREVERIAAFLESILTPNEIREISSRWELVKLLDAGMSQRQIARKLGLSLCKITRGSRELKRKDSPFKQMIDAGKRGAMPLRMRGGKRRA